jgi:uncharacterized phage infection (PIP) family protein YhgE
LIEILLIQKFQEAFKDGKVKIVLVIPSDFSENLSLQKKQIFK